jgi:hypothetical protein
VRTITATATSATSSYIASTPIHVAVIPIGGTVAMPVDGATIKLYWDPSLTGIPVISRMRPGGTFTAITGMIASNTFTDTGLESGRTYQYELQFGTSAPLTTSAARTWRMGDLDGNGAVDQTDADILAINNDSGATTGHTWTQGDLNADGLINAADATLLDTASSATGATAAIASGAPASAIGIPYTLSLSTTGGPSDGADYWTIDWGDSTSITTLSVDSASARIPLGLTHTYTSAGAFTITATEYDTTGDFDATSSNGNPVSVIVDKVHLSAADAIDQGQPYIITVPTALPGAIPITSWQINWGDGSDADHDGAPGETIPGSPSTLTHVYQNAGNYTATATAMYTGGQ